MNVVKVELLLATVLSFMSGTVGCATGQTINTLPMNAVIFDGGQPTMQVATVGDTTNARIASRPANSAAINSVATAPVSQVAHASFPQSVQPMPNAMAAAPLTTLNPGDDLLGMIQQTSGVVLLDFYADWCGPCRTQGGILHEMEHTASQNGSSMIKVNVDQHRSLASAFNVTSLPTLILIKDGRIIERQTGIANHQRVADLLSR